MKLPNFDTWKIKLILSALTTSPYSQNKGKSIQFGLAPHLALLVTIKIISLLILK